MEPEGIKRGSAKYDLQEETKKVNKNRRPHSLKKFLTEGCSSLLET